MAVSGLVLVGCSRIRRWLGDSVVSALEKLMGLVLTAIAVEMILAGLKRYFAGLGLLTLWESCTGPTGDLCK